MRTYDSSSAVLELDAGNVVVIAENTTMSVAALGGDPANPITRFFMNVGTVFSMHPSALGTGGLYQVDTPRGTASLRGSYVSISYQPGSSTSSRITCLEGHCSATSAAQTVELMDKQAVDIDPQGKIGTIGPLTPKDIQDWTKALDEAKSAGLLPNVQPEQLLPAAAGVPLIDLTGMTIDDATAALQALGLSIVVSDSKPCVNAEAGQVSAQSPDAGTTADAGTTVEVVECTGAPATGDVQVTLTWGSTSDLDLVVTDPDGNQIYYSVPFSPTGGKLDVDANGYCTPPLTTSPVENIYWGPGQAPHGTYTVEVVYSIDCNSIGGVAYEVTVLVDGKSTTYNGSVTEGDDVTVTTFTR